MPQRNMHIIKTIAYL